MNIAVQTYEGNFVSRPDTTFRRGDEWEEVYFPDHVSAIQWAPALFVRLSKAGNGIQVGFADRHYDAVGFGMLLYPSDFLDGSEQGFARACCLNHSTIIPFPLFNPAVLGSPSNEFILSSDSKELFRCGTPDASALALAIAGSSSLMHVRNGDFLAIEMSPRTLLTSRDKGRTHISGTFCDKETIGLDIVF